MEPINPKVSVIIPLYNKGPYISDTLNSIFSQTVQDFEIIVVNDGSTDDGMKIVQAFDDPRIRLINQHNRGISNARNQGAKYAKADIFAFLDADDQWHTEFLETVLTLAEKYPQAGAFATGIEEIIDNKKVVQKYRTIPNNGYEGLVPDFFYSAIIGERVISSSSVAIKRSVFIEMSGFKEGIAWGEDTDFFSRIALKYPIAFNSKICSMYFIRDAAQKAKNRVAETKEHPFIKSGTDFLNKNQGRGKNFSNIIIYIDKLRILSARLNLMIGNSTSAREILLNCKNFKIYKNFLLFWTLMPENLYKMFGQYLFRFCIYCIILIKKVSRSAVKCKEALYPTSD
jgi:glycosyltransferase involved in cell wall biosynthesis